MSHNFDEKKHTYWLGKCLSEEHKKKMSKAQKRRTILAYTAGLVDGEGCIKISINKPNKKNGGKLDKHYLDVNVTNTNKEVIYWLKNEFGGSVYTTYGECQGKKHKQIWRWTIVSNQAKDFLKLIYPYFIIKKEQAKLGIEFQKNKKYMNQQKLDFQLKEIAWREYYKQEISKLKQGVKNDNTKS